MSAARNSIYDLLDKNTHTLSVLDEVENAVKQSDGGGDLFRDRVLPIRMRILEQQKALLKAIEMMAA